jgi:hypothetical protein
MECRATVPLRTELLTVLDEQIEMLTKKTFSSFTSEEMGAFKNREQRIRELQEELELVSARTAQYSDIGVFSAVYTESSEQEFKITSGEPSRPLSTKQACPSVPSLVGHALTSYVPFPRLMPSLYSAFDGIVRFANEGCVLRERFRVALPVTSHVCARHPTRDSLSLLRLRMGLPAPNSTAGRPIRLREVRTHRSPWRDRLPVHLPQVSPVDRGCGPTGESLPSITSFVD